MRTGDLKIKIGDNPKVDALQEWGLHLIDADKVLFPDLRDYESINYPEENGEKVYPYTKLEPFDYTITIGAKGPDNAINAQVKSFYDNLFMLDDGRMKAEIIIIYNLYHGVRIEGITKGIKVTDFYNGDEAVWVFDLTIRVYDPEKCDFNYEE